MTTSDQTTISLNRFSICIPEAKPLAQSPQYVGLQEGTCFSLKLGNMSDSDADCSVYLDGILMGHYRVCSGRAVVAERPTALAQKFTYAAQGSVKSFDQDLPLDAASIGLIHAVFKPASTLQHSTLPPPLKQPRQPEAPAPHPFRIESSAAASRQQFVTVPSVDGDATPTHLYMRLIPSDTPVASVSPVSSESPVLSVSPLSPVTIGVPMAIKATCVQ